MAQKGLPQRIKRIRVQPRAGVGVVEQASAAIISTGITLLKSRHFAVQRIVYRMSVNKFSLERPFSCAPSQPISWLRVQSSSVESADSPAMSFCHHGPQPIRARKARACSNAPALFVTWCIDLRLEPLDY